jgi:hypothetical protein
MKAPPIRVAEKWGQEYSAGVNRRHLSAPNLSAKWLGTITISQPRQLGRKETKRVGPAGDGPEGGYSRAGLSFADE